MHPSSRQINRAFSLLAVLLVPILAIGTARGAPPTPTNPSPGSYSSPGPVLSSSTVTFSWNASSGATSYNLGVVDVATGSFVVATYVTSTSYTANLTAGKTYRWNVAADNSAGESYFTNPLYFQTPTAATTYSISPNPASVNENAGTLTFTVSRSNSSSAVTVYASTVQDQGYTNNGYYNGLMTQTVNFSAGQSSTTVPLTINDKGLTSGSEKFSFIIQTYASGSYSTVATDVFTIINNDVAPTTYSISPNPASVNENAGTLTFTVSRSNSSSAITVYASTVQDQGYTNNGYYNGLVTQPIIFSAGQSSVPVPLTINDKGLTSGSEKFSFWIQTYASGSYTTVATDVFTIINNDVATSPTAPTNLVAYGTTGALLLQWNDNSNNESGFKIERSVGGPGSYAYYTSVGSNSGSSDAYADTSVSNGTVYYYRVYAYSSGGNSSYTNEADGMPLAVPVLSAPSDGSTIPSGSSVALQWNTVTGANRYGVDMGTSYGATDVLNNLPVTGNSYAMSGLTSRTYYWRVRASNTTYPGVSDVSGCWSFTLSASSTRIIGVGGDLSFGPVTVGQSAQQTMTITNTGNSPLNVSSITYPVGFSGNWSGGAVAANGGSRQVTVTFSPTAQTSYGGTVTVNCDMTGGINTTWASGSGTAGSTRIINLTGDLSFGPVTVGQSAQHTFTVNNTGSSALTVSSITYPPGFSGDWSGGTIAANAGLRQVTVTFSPTAQTSYGGTVTVNCDMTSGTNTTWASGNGTAGSTRIIKLSGDLTFGLVTVGQSAQRTLTISNTGNSTLTISSITYPPGFAGGWSNGTIAPNSGSKQVTVTFSPTAQTTYSGTVTVNCDMTGGTDTTWASGSGTTGTVSPAKTPTGFFYPTGKAEPYDARTMPAFLAGGPGKPPYWPNVYHLGQDMEASVGDPVYAISNGSIVYVSAGSAAGWGDDNYGLLVKHRLSTGDDFLALYGHVRPTSGTLKYASSGPVSPPVPVSAGVAFASIGPGVNGVQTWDPHLHFGVHPGATIPPSPWGRMPLSDWPDPNGFTEPVSWIETKTPYSSAAATLSVTPPDRPAGSETGSTTFNVSSTGTGTMNWSASVTSGGDWLSIASGLTGAAPGTINVHYDANPQTNQRIGRITVTAIGAQNSPQSVTVTQAAAGAPPPGTILGLDCANQIDWAEASRENYQFGFCKITEGLYWPAAGSTTQKAFESNVSACLQTGMIVGAYHFGRPVANPSLGQAQGEGKTFADAFNALRQKYPQATWLCPVLDIENYDDVSRNIHEHPSSLEKGVLSQWVLAWIAEVKRIAKVNKVIIYADRDSAGYLDSNVAAYPLWIADPSSAVSPSPLGPWSQWAFSQKGPQNQILPGIGKVDIDVFNGDKLALMLFVPPRSTQSYTVTPATSSGGNISPSTPQTVSILALQRYPLSGVRPRRERLAARLRAW